ncbi:Poly(A) RNA polymerase protein 2 [Babesia bigemina]|uniref:Poly(A) RNA polymerase protein 2 n=1 Tax=Babesia bigemina TaxID=5866 RepID=A0A061D8K9_BABBI|nr:Poly(A) RNA polymerase protein 2 [Babesia bigemina]CDR96853.1 Poly(A) RNA polymerase protein 2 [Babesia bigemina]|eukprot:XP_012769039.1 Poly(A) RNA polymerase protein 2 [Babesia bigemina]
MESVGDGGAEAPSVDAGAAADDGSLVANLSTEDYDRLSAFYGPELYSMVEDEKHREIVERNSAMREAVKGLGKVKLGARSKLDAPCEFINIPREKLRQDKDTSAKGANQKNLVTVLGLKKLYNALYTPRVPFRVKLDVELAKLLEWIAPSDEERAHKEKLCTYLAHVGDQLRRASTFADATGLSLPGGDIDVCIQTTEDELSTLKLLVYAMSKMDLLHSFECIFNAKVPVVKAIDKATGVKLDISIWQQNAMDTTQFIKDKCEQYKYMQPLILLIKLFLQLRNLNDTYIGGIGSYLLYCMVLSFLQLHVSSCSRSKDEENTLASLYVDFFYYWGFLRDYNQFATTVRGFGHVFPKSLLSSRDTALLACESPLETSVDIGKNAFNMGSARASFQNAFFVLMEKQNMSGDRGGGSGAHDRQDCILEALYDPSHPIFQHRSESTIKRTMHQSYDYQKLASPENSLKEVCEHLRRMADNAESAGTANRQKPLAASVSHKPDDGTAGDEQKSLPFYVIADAVTREFYSTD